jgi:hypothetical protein
MVAKVKNISLLDPAILKPALFECIFETQSGSPNPQSYSLHRPSFRQIPPPFHQEIASKVSL